MMASGHMAMGALLTGLVGPLLPSPLSPSAAVALAATAGAYHALVMDLDTRGKCYHLLAPFSWLIKPLLVGISKLLFHLTRGDDDPEETNGHRMFTHQPAFPALLAGLTLWLTWDLPEWRWYAAGVVFVGVWAHRPGDAMTKHGVPIGLLHVLVRFFRGEQRVWITVGLPHKLRFVTGGKSGRRRFGAKSARVWDMTGEALVTAAMVGLVVVLGAATAAGLYPLVLT